MGDKGSFLSSIPIAAEGGILRGGENCWCVSTADKASLLIDADEYFRRLAQTLPLARRSLWIVGWDFDPRIKLQPDRADGPTLGEHLRHLVETTPELEIRVLVWAIGAVYSSRSLHLFTQHQWADHPRIFLRFDARHPLRASHHQKLVCIDDATAFVGGIDLTGGRWDTCDHAATSAIRTSPSGEPYGPVHDVQLAVAGPIARYVGRLARRRWKWATEETVEEEEPAPAPWPADLTPDLTRCTAAIARTEPGTLRRVGKREVLKLTLDAIAAARRHIYIESQYLTSFRIGDVLARRLAEPDGPEIVVVVTRSSRGLLEHFIMGHNRNRLIRRLKAADRFGRLRISYAVVPDGDGGEQEVLIHSKVIVVDDILVRIGSSNLNNRSEGLDTECDIALEAHDKAERLAIGGFRDRLLAEHLACPPEAFSAALAEGGSVIAAIDQLNLRPRGLRDYSIARDGKTTAVLGTGLLDPRHPSRRLQKLRAAAFRLFGQSG